jgi:exosortase/archaeosortase family protein
MLKVLDATTDATLDSVIWVLKYVPIAHPISTLDNTLFEVSYHGSSFPLSIVSACSGANSVVGFLLVGSAFAAIVRGPLIRKILWLAGGMALLWSFNVGRILFIFWAGKTWGESIAINVLHPFIGLVTFSIGVVIMMLLIKPLGMHIGIGQRPQPTVLAQEPPGIPAAGALAPNPLQANEPKRILAVPKIYGAVVVVLAVGLVLGASNLALKSFNLVADVAGQAKLVSYIDEPVAPTGWSSDHIATYDWSKPLFGDSSIWNRYELYPTFGGDLHADADVVADVIDTPDLSSFSAYGVEQCYQFHGYSLADVAQVKLSGGITGQAMAYTSQQFGSWSIVYWIIPVKSGTTTVYERTVLYVQNTHGVVTKATSPDQTDIRNLAGTLNPDDKADLVLLQNRAFLVAFAKQFIQSQAYHSVVSTPINSVS